MYTTARPAICGVITEKKIQCTGSVGLENKHWAADFNSRIAVMLLMD